MQRTRGFTLIELVSVIVILAIVSVGVFSFVSIGTRIYVDVTERDQILSEARFVLERLNRELRRAVPNSIRISANSRCIEFAPIAWSSFYEDIAVSPEPATDEIELASLGNYQREMNDRVVVYPLEPDHIYLGGDAHNVAPDANPVSGNTLLLTSDHQFATDSPARRLYIGREPVSYCLSGNSRLTRHTGYAYRDVQSESPTNAGIGTGVLMARHIINDPTDANDRPFTLESATLNRNALVQLQLRFELNEELVVFNSEVHLPNVP
ncbi:PulJ/GspJ family protein [Lacimicrobium alkaliphilum]|uniref:MSHA biogenesis protein MshO n=1 Tax=Lacimicrobium alkaliphilum TaxID=1526571 RepID=A0ABQ1R894_9ALTE|nr:type II secretion system protein [Lacimicrobium alkaliphilum]GGD61908.1 MSHA biogenesis protein MshO [Lacimicrobium alkaliphilum]